MKDLLGTDLPDPPPMNAPIPWRVYRVSDFEWFVARTREEAASAAAETWGYLSLDDAVRQTEIDMDEVVELTDDELQNTNMCDDDGRSTANTFATTLAYMVKRGIDAPQFFATTEY